MRNATTTRTTPVYQTETQQEQLTPYSLSSNRINNSTSKLFQPFRVEAFGPLTDAPNSSLMTPPSQTSPSSQKAIFKARRHQPPQNQLFNNHLRTTYQIRT